MDQSSTGDYKVLSYGDNLLRQSDLNLLDGPHWLNDQIITFYFDYLWKERFGQEQDSLLMVGGAMTFLLSQLAGTGDIAGIVAPMQLDCRTLILFAVNNNPDASAAEGGSHWTLLMYSSSQEKFYHFDSSPGSDNLRMAKQIALAVRPHLGCSTSNSKLQAAQMPAQTNAYDCGVYVLACAELIMEQWTKGFREEAVEHTLRKQLTPHLVREKRSQILLLIKAKAASKHQAC